MTLAQKIGLKWKGLLNILIFFLLVGIAYTAIDRKADSTVEALVVTVDDYQGKSLLSTADVKDILVQNFENALINRSISMLDLELIEAILSEEEMVKDVEVFVDMQNHLHVEVWTQKPQFRVFVTSDQSVYVGPDGQVFPSSSPQRVRLPVVNGHLPWITRDDDPRKGQLVSLMNAIDKDDFIAALTDQIYITEREDLILVPRLHDVEILLGDLAEAQENLQKLRPFYAQTVKKLGLDSYRKLDLRYEDQVVCTLREDRT